MADLVEKILVQVTLDKDQLITGLTEVKTKLDANKVAIAQLKEQIKSLAQKGDTQGVRQLNEQLVLIEANTKTLTTSQRQLQTQLLQTTQANVAQKGSYEQLYRTWQVAQTQLKLLGETTGTASAEFIQQSAAVAELKEQIDRFNLSLNDGRTNVGQYEKSFKGVRQEVRDLSQEHKAGRLAATGITSAINLLSIAQGNAGEKTELQKNATILMNGAMAIQGIQLGIVAGKEVLLAAQMGITTAATNVQATATGILSRVQTFLQAQFGLSAAAARGFAVALTATGIGAIIVAIGFAVAAFQSFTSSVNDSADALQKLDEARKKQAEDDKYFNSLTVQALENQLTLIKLKGGTLEDQHKLELQINEAQITDYERIKQRQGFLDDEDFKNYQNLLQQKEIINEQFNVDTKKQNDESEKENKRHLDELTKQQEEKDKKLGEDMAKEIDQIRQHEKDIQDFLSEVDPSLEQIVNKILEGDDKLVKAEKEYTKAVEDENRKRIEIQQKTVAAFNDLEQSKAEFVSQTAGSLLNSFKKTSTAYKLFFTFQKGAAVADVIIKMNQEIAGIAAANASLGAAGIPITLAQTTAAKIRAASSVISILATFLPAFAQGGVTGKRISSRDGVPIQRSNGDNMLITAKTDEVILNQQQQRLLGGAATFRAIGVPGFAQGGLLDGGLSFRAATPDSSNLDLLSVLDLIADKSPVVRVVDINNVQGNVARIESAATI